MVSINGNSKDFDVFFFVGNWASIDFDRWVTQLIPKTAKTLRTLFAADREKPISFVHLATALIAT